MTDQPTTDATHGLSVQHADALWDAVAIPGPTEPTFPMQHERVCRAVAEILAELTPASPAVPVSSPPPDQTAACFCRTNPTLTARIGYPVRCPHCPPDAGPVPPTHWTKHVQRHHPEAARVLPPPADRAAVYREVADRLTTDAHGMQPDWARIYKRDAANKVREWAERLDGEGRQDGSAHSCGNCDGIDPGTCLMNPNRPPEQCPNSEFDGYGLQCQKPAGHNLCTFEEQPSPVHKGGNADDRPGPETRP